MAMENGPFIDDFPIKTSIYKGFSMAMLNNQMVYQRFAQNPLMTSLGLSIFSIRHWFIRSDTP